MPKRQRKQETIDPVREQITGISGGHHLVIAPGGCGKTDILATRVANVIKERDNGDLSDILCVTFTRSAAAEMISRIGDNSIHSTANDRNIDFSEEAHDIDISTLHSICKKLLERSYCESHQVPYGHYSILWSDSDVKALGEDGKHKTIRGITTDAFFQVLKKKAFRYGKGKLKQISTRNIEEHPLLLISARYNLKFVEPLYYDAAYKLSHTLHQKKIGMPEELYLHKEYTEKYIKGIRKPDWGLLLKVAEKINDAKFHKSKNKEKMQYVDFDDILCLIWKELHEGKIGPRYRWVQVDEIQDLSRLQLEIIRMLTINDGKETVVYFGDPHQAIFSFMGGCPENVDSVREEVGDKVYELRVNHRSNPKLIQYQNHFMKKFFGVEKDSWIIPREKIKENGPAVEIRKFPDSNAEKEWIVNYVNNPPENGRDKSIAVLFRTNNDCGNFEKRLIKIGLNVIRFSDEKIGSFEDVKPVSEALLEMSLINGWEDSYADDVKVGEVIGEIVNKSDDPFLKALVRYAKMIQEQIRGKRISFADCRRMIFGSTVDAMFDKGVFEEPGSVIITTVHKAKGRGFDTVIVPSLVDGIYPYYDCRKGEKFNEEARVFYVAISRPKSKLILTYPEKCSLPEKYIVKKKKHSKTKKATTNTHKRVKVSVRTRVKNGKVAEVKPSRFIVKPRGTLSELGLEN